MSLFSVRGLTKLTGIPSRRVRYVIDHELIPDRNWFVGQGEAGSPRYFDLATAWYVVCAAAMMEAGLRRENVQQFMSVADIIAPKPRKRGLTLRVIDEALVGTSEAKICIGDNSHVRGIVGKTDTGWLRLESTHSEDNDFCPMVEICIDIGRIRDSLKKVTHQA